MECTEMTEAHVPDRETKIAWACRALLSGRSIGQGDEIAEAAGWRLAAIAWRLKAQYGWPILTEYTPENHARYKLARNCDRSKLTLPPSAR
jgi:hypothetical protein